MEYQLVFPRWQGARAAGVSLGEYSGMVGLARGMNARQSNNPVQPPILSFLQGIALRVLCTEQVLGQEVEIEDERLDPHHGRLVSIHAWEMEGDTARHRGLPNRVADYFYKPIVSTWTPVRT